MTGGFPSDIAEGHTLTQRMNAFQRIHRRSRERGTFMGRPDGADPLLSVDRRNLTCNGQQSMIVSSDAR
jgi:hypothetical protein